MTKLLDAIKQDADFIRSHSLQPQWFKALKVLILLGFLLGYSLFFGWRKTVLFSAVFLLLMLVVHLVYRTKTKAWKQSWLDFLVSEQENKTTPRRIGKYYYSAVAINAAVSVVISQVLA